MKATIWGCRGSLAAPGPETVRYGGNTSCVEVRLDDGSVVVLDAGTGLRALGIKLAEERVGTIHLLLSHLHLDHLQGLGFFRPLFDRDVDVHIWGPTSPMHGLDQRIAAYLSPPLFPVTLSQIPCRLTFHDAPEDDAWTLGSATVRATKVAHQGPTVGYRLEEGGRSICYIPDHEPAIGVDLATLGKEWISGHHLAAGCDVLLHDAQYTEEEYPNHVGWGHSSINHVVTFARIADVSQLVLFHHDPLHTDSQLDDVLVRARQLWPGGSVALAYEGMDIALESAGAVATSPQ